MDLLTHLKDQWEFSQKTFGPIEFKNHMGPLNHIRKELIEIEDEPTDPYEWADLILLSFDGAMRANIPPEIIVKAISEKLEINKNRDWPDWRGTDPNDPIEHTKE